MDKEEAAIFAMTLTALQSANDGVAEKGLIENANPTTATCTVERSN